MCMWYVKSIKEFSAFFNLPQMLANLCSFSSTHMGSKADREEKILSQANLLSILIISPTRQVNCTKKDMTGMIMGSFHVTIRCVWLHIEMLSMLGVSSFRLSM